MRIVKIFIWTGCCREQGKAGPGLGEEWMKCLVTGEDSIALGPNKLVYTFLVAQFLMSTGKPETHPAHTHPAHTLTHTQTLASCLVCACVVLGFGCWHFSVAAFSSRSATSKHRFSFFLLLQFSLFISGFAFSFFFFLSSRFLYFLCCCHCTLRQLLWRLSTKICSNFSCLAWPRFALPNTRVSSSSKPQEKLIEGQRKVAYDYQRGC